MKLKRIYQNILSRQILTSRGDFTVEIEIHTCLGIFRSSCPSGASKGKKEAKAAVDEMKNGVITVNRAIFNLKTFFEPKITKLLDISIDDQYKIDKFMCDLDGSESKIRIGANVILPLSMAFSRAGAAYKELSLREYIASLSDSVSKMPFPYFNVINGGVHAGNNLPFQEIMISFHNSDYERNLHSAAIFYRALKNTIIEKYGLQATGIGDEGGFAPPIDTLEEALDLIMMTYENLSLEKMYIALDCAASEFYKDGKYNLDFKKKEQKNVITSNELISYYKRLCEKYELLHMIEDPFHEDDHESWAEFMKYAKQNSINIIGDDLTVTNIKYINNAIEKKFCNGLLVKLDQIGTVSEAIEAVKLARSANMKIMVSHRSGETEDTYIADFATGLGADYIKAGAPCRGERVAKYNQLLRIWNVISKQK